MNLNLEDKVLQLDIWILNMLKVKIKKYKLKVGRGYVWFKWSIKTTLRKANVYFVCKENICGLTATNEALLLLEKKQICVSYRY